MSSGMKPQDTRRVSAACAIETESWPRRNYTKPWLTKPKLSNSQDCISPPPPPIPVVPLGALPVWDTSPPRSSRILVHQILQKGSNSKPTPTTVPGSEKRKGNSGADISKVHHVDAIAYILDLRREIDTRLTYDADPPVSGQESVFEEFHLDTAFN